MTGRGRGEMTERVWGSQGIEPLPPYRRRVRARTPDEDGALGVNIKSVKESDIVHIIGTLPGHTMPAHAMPSHAKPGHAKPSQPTRCEATRCEATPCQDTHTKDTCTISRS